MTRHVQAFKVMSSDVRGHARRISVEGTDGRTAPLRMHRYALVGKGDEIVVDPAHPGRISLPSCENCSDLIRVTPHFNIQSELRIGRNVYPLRFTEITSEQELQDYLYLEQFHYKTSALLEEQDVDEQRVVPETGGRKAVLLGNLKMGARWEPFGYIELQMPLLMVKPRHVLFSMPFDHPTRPVKWERWDQTAFRKFVNVIVRIARVVTNPEFRGIGLAKHLIVAAKAFSQERWHIKGRRPLFIEISAEMLNYFDFVTSAGLRFVDRTEGNIARISADIVSMQRNPKISSGIMSLQKKYLTNFRKATEALGRDFASAVGRLTDLCEHPERLNSLPAEDWYLFKTVLRTPIPYFIAGLDEYSESYVDGALSQAAGNHKPQTVSLATRPTTIHIRGLKATSNFAVPDNTAVRKIMDCFGLRGERISNGIFGPLDLQATSGNILFVCGASGTGKSMLLRSLDPQLSHHEIIVDKKQDNSETYTVGWIREITSSAPLIQYFSEQYGMERALAALNQAGLSEAFVYLKPYAHLSRGQRYRAKLADLALRSDQLWLIDEFCADLDPMTATIVARNLRRHVVKYRRIAIVAAANYRHFIDALAPTRVLLLRFGGKAEMFAFKEFVDEFPDAAR